MVRVRRGNTDLEVGAELRLISIEYFRLSQEIEGYKPYEVFVERSTLQSLVSEPLKNRFAKLQAAAL
jgi:hypothetical protein